MNAITKKQYKLDKPFLYSIDKKRVLKKNLDFIAFSAIELEYSELTSPAKQT